MDLPTGKTWCAGGWDDGSSVEKLQAAFPGAVLEVHEFRNERTVVVDAAQAFDMLAFLRDDAKAAFDFLTDVTAVHWPARPEPFEIVWLLYSFQRNARLRVKARVADPPRAPSVVPLWPAAGWLERECYDMFGVVFEGHPDLRGIRMPSHYEGQPVRKEHPLKC